MDKVIKGVSDDPPQQTNIDKRDSPSNRVNYRDTRIVCCLLPRTRQVATRTLLAALVRCP